MVDRVRDFWADGHYVAATTPGEAGEVCVHLYGHDPAHVRPWTDTDQAKLDIEE